MITLETAMKIANYKISESSEYMWKCYGPNARYLDFDHNKDSSFSIVFDTENQTVYQAAVCDYVKDNCYCIHHPDFYDEHKYEAESRNVSPLEAYDGVNFIELEKDEDFIEKATAIINNEPYDERISIDLDLKDNELYELMIRAHQMDVTLNDYIAYILEKLIEKN